MLGNSLSAVSHPGRMTRLAPLAIAYHTTAGNAEQSMGTSSTVRCLEQLRAGFLKLFLQTLVVFL